MISEIQPKRLKQLIEQGKADANMIIKAARFFCEADNGLAHDWPGKAYVNAPYAHPIVEDFAHHLIDQYMRGITREAIWLSNASTSNEWWRDLARRGVVCHAGCLRFGKIDGDRVTYPRGRSQFEQSIIYLGRPPRRPFARSSTRSGW